MCVSQGKGVEMCLYDVNSKETGNNIYIIDVYFPMYFM